MITSATHRKSTEMKEWLRTLPWRWPLAPSNLIRAIGSASEIKLHAFFLVKRASRKIKEARSRAWRWLHTPRFIALICSNGFFSLSHEGCVQCNGARAAEQKYAWFSSVRDACTSAAAFLVPTSPTRASLALAGLLCAHLLLRAPRVLRFELWEKGGRKKYNALSIKCKTKIDLTRSALSLLPAELVAAIIWQRQHHGEHRNHQPATPFSLILSWRFFSLLGARTPSQLRGHVLCRMIRTWPLAPRRMPWNNYPPPTDMCVCGLGGERFDLWPAKLFRGLPRPV